MTYAAFTTPIPLQQRGRHTESCTPRMSVTVPRPSGPPLAAAIYQRTQERREGFFGPTFTSDLLDEDQATPAFRAQAALTNLLGNAHVFESERALLTPIVTRFEVTLDARELVREVAKSSLFRTRYFDRVSNTRFVEILFKVLLARAPSSQAEVAGTLAKLHSEGYDAAIDAIVDSAEYAMRFGNVLFPCMSACGDYAGGMPGFCAQMRLQLPTRGGTSEVTCKTPMTTGVLGGGNPAGCFEIETAYRVTVPNYEPELGWMQLPRSSLLTDWASMSLIPGDAAVNWVRATPRETGEAKGPWESGWEPKPSGEEWSSGWALKVYKSYV